MHTKGLAAERISGLYEGDALATALADARTRTLAIYAHLDLPAVRFPCLPIVNPPLWELAHIAWFQELWCLRSRGSKHELNASLLRGADELFNSSTVPHDSRWHLDYPSAERLLRYMRDTFDATQEELARTPEGRRYFFRLACFHEDMHAEALLMTLQTLALPAPPIDARDPPPAAANPANDVFFEGGEFDQGTWQAEFAFDNEREAHAVRVEPFAMASRPVTQGEFAAFVEDSGATPPAHWRRDGSRWEVRRFDRWAALDASAPMLHASLKDALAYCAWAKRRLPTESEWEYAARNGGGMDRFPWGDEAASGETLDLRYRGPSLALPDPRPSKSGLRQLMGGVWEWTSTAFAPYPGFHADPYRDYSQPWFHTHYVLRGGSFATRSRLVHNRFRNFYAAGRTDPFAGFRICAV